MPAYRRSRATSNLAELMLLCLAGVAAAGAGMTLSGLEPKLMLAALVGLAGIAGMLVAGASGLLVPGCIGALAFGLTVAFDISVGHHFFVAGSYVPNIGGAAAYTISLVFIAAIALTIGYMTLSRAGTRDFVLRIHWPLTVAQLAFMASGLLSLLNAGDRTLVYLEEIRMLQALFIFTVAASLTSGQIRLFVLFISGGILLQAAAASVQFLTNRDLGLAVFGDVGAMSEAINNSSQARGTGFKGNPNILAYYFEILYPVCLGVALSRAPQWLRLAAAAGAVAALGGLVVTLSRGGWMTVPISTLAILAFVYRDRLFSRPAVGGLVVLLVVGLIGLATVGPLMFERLTADDGGSTSHRMPLNIAALSMISSFPVFGAGLNNFGNMFALYDTTGYSRLFTDQNHVVHNMYLLVLGEVGIVGLLAFFAMFITGWVSAVRSWRRRPWGDPMVAVAIGAGVGLFGQCFHGLFDPGYRLSLGIVELVAVAFGLIAAVSFETRGLNRDGQHPEHRSQR